MTGKPRINLMRIEQDLSSVHLRLARVYVENVPYQKMIRKADREHTFFYIDPPYYGFEDYYGKGVFDRKDFEHLKDILSQIKGKFLMSINDTEEIRELFKSFKLERVKTVYTVSGGSRSKKVQELLIMNYSLN